MGSSVGYPPAFLLSLDYVLCPLQELSQSNQRRTTDVGRAEANRTCGGIEKEREWVYQSANTILITLQFETIH